MPDHDAGVADCLEEVLHQVLLAVAEALVGAIAVVRDAERSEFGDLGQELRVLHQLEIGEQDEMHLAALGAVAREIRHRLRVVVELPCGDAVALGGVQHFHAAVLRVPFAHGLVERCG